jgi:hypothetical protein
MTWQLSKGKYKLDSMRKVYVLAVALMNSWLNYIDLLQRSHNVSLPCRLHQHQHVLDIPDASLILSQSQHFATTNTTNKKKDNYNRIVKRLRYKLIHKKSILRKTDKSKGFHLRQFDDYQTKFLEYMKRMQHYQCFGMNDPLSDLIQRTNKHLLDFRLAKWITQKQYEIICIKSDEVEFAHLHYLPKAHKPGTPLRPIISDLRQPTIKVSKFLDNHL